MSVVRFYYFVRNLMFIECLTTFITLYFCGIFLINLKIIKYYSIFHRKWKVSLEVWRITTTLGEVRLNPWRRMVILLRDPTLQKMPRLYIQTLGRWFLKFLEKITITSKYLFCFFGLLAKNVSILFMHFRPNPKITEEGDEEESDEEMKGYF